MGVFDSTPFNSNYQYFNLKQKTMPNGLGMGGQLEYFGLWIDSEFGQVENQIFWMINKNLDFNKVRTAPTCSTFHSPALGQPEGKIKRLEVKYSPICV